MAHIVAEPCKNNKCTNCVTVCPVDSFREDIDMLFIDPETCIDCGACTAECPVEAIFVSEDVPEKWKNYIELNTEKAKVLPLINEKKV